VMKPRTASGLPSKVKRQQAPYTFVVVYGGEKGTPLFLIVKSCVPFVRRSDTTQRPWA